jgi:hypothetical protein
MAVLLAVAVEEVAQEEQGTLQTLLQIKELTAVTEGRRLVAVAVAAAQHRLVLLVYQVELKLGVMAVLVQHHQYQVLQ